ncbi:ABC transporter permease [Geopsychrobacter electrodiphilus]|uniref:ABC transporter permease n=1 Tax=Geopsychrobacter electrodiphilus TaxID=225196 RepID=UPI00037E3854|nr:ABC transporter permease subunit [Geopsychrobacter electrodiphilus]
MFLILQVTMKGIFKDRVFHGILMVALLLLSIPLLSQFSMRQVTELSITLSLSLISFILLLLAVFLGGTSIWKDMERRYTFSVLSLPVSRTSYLLGKFFGVALFLLFTAFILGGLALLVIWFVSGNFPPDRPIVWLNIVSAICFDALKYILLVAFAVLFSTVSTSFFLPIFGAISIFFVGNASQQVYDYVHSAAGQVLSVTVRNCASGLYYIVPNFSAFDFKVNAIYGLPIATEGIFLTLGYLVVYSAIVLTLATMLFSRREIK